jgi:hypothetical protein
VDEIKLGIAQHRGLRAEELLNNQLLKDAFAYLETEYLKAWKATKVRDTEAREKLWQAIQIVGIIQEHLKVFIRDGKVAAMDLKRLSEEAERKNARSRN